MPSEAEMKKRIRAAYGPKRKTYLLILIVVLVAAAAVYFMANQPADAQQITKNVADINDTLKSASDAIGSIAENIK